MKRDLSLGDLSRRSGEPEEEIAAWRRLGLLGLEGEAGFGHEDLERIRVVRLLLRRGIPLDDIARSVRGGYLRSALDTHLSQVFPGDGRPAYSAAEAAAEVGMDEALLGRLWRAAAAGRQADILSQDDLEILRAAKLALSMGYPEDALRQLMATWADSLGRAAEVVSRLNHFYLHERGMGAAFEEGSNVAQIAAMLTPILEPTVLLFLRKGLVWANPADLVMHVEQEIGLRTDPAVPGEMSAAVVFVDLSSFTPLAEAMGDAKAVEILERFSVLVRDIAGKWSGQVVKQIGDAFLLIFQHCAAAIAAAVEIADRAATEPQFPAVRGGIHWGNVLYREADYVGSTVNIAARVTAEADRHEILATDAVRREAMRLGTEIEFAAKGPQRLKGVTEPVELFALKPRRTPVRDRRRDPVCGMELGPTEIAATLATPGREVAFCSQACLRKFVAAPDRYRDPDGDR